MVGVLLNLHYFVRVFNSHHRESRSQEIDAWIAEGKVPIEVDLSEHPEKSIKSRACMFLELYSVSFYEVHSFDRAHGEGCCNHQ
jgi:hypothetical protein